MPDAHWLYPTFLVVYLGALVLVGAYKARRIRSQEDFSLAGRGLGTFVLVGTLLATWIGTGSIFGNAEKTYEIGLGALVLPLSSAAGIAMLWVLAPRIRRFGQFTIQDVLEARFGAAVRIAGTVALLAAYVIIVSYQYRAGAAVLSYLAPELDRGLAIALVAAFVILYTALAGLVSVAYTDVANGLLMLVGLGLAIPYLWVEVGGLDAALEAVGPARASAFGHFSLVGLLSVLLPPFLLVMGDANMVQRFFAAKTPEGARRAAGGMLVGVLVLDWAIVVVALFGAALVASGSIPAPAAGREGELVVHLGFTALPPLLGALLVSTVVAVIVSTADSFLLSPATSLVRDVWQRFLKPSAGDLELVRAGRTIVVVLGLLALGLAYTADSFFDVALFAYTIYGASLTPVIIAVWFWPRATRAGALSSMTVGLVTAVGWKAAAELAPASALGTWIEGTGADAVIVALPASALALVVVSLLGRPPDRVV